MLVWSAVVKSILLCSCVVKLSTGSRWIWPGEVPSARTPTPAPSSFRIPRQSSILHQTRPTRVNAVRTNTQQRTHSRVIKNNFQPQFQNAPRQVRNPNTRFNNRQQNNFQQPQFVNQRPQTFTPHPIDISQLPLDSGDDILSADFTPSSRVPEASRQSHSLGQINNNNNNHQLRSARFNPVEIRNPNQANFDLFGQLNTNQITSSFLGGDGGILPNGQTLDRSLSEISRAKVLLDIPDISQLPLENTQETLKRSAFPSSPSVLPVSESSILNSGSSLFISPSRIRASIDSTNNSFHITTLQPRNVIKSFTTRPNITPASFQSSQFSLNLLSQRPTVQNLFGFTRTASPSISKPVTSVPLHITTPDNELVIKPAQLLTTTKTRINKKSSFGKPPVKHFKKKLPSPPPLPESLIKLLQGKKPTTKKSNFFNPRDDNNNPETKENEDDIIFIIEDDPLDSINIQPKQSSLDMLLNLDPRRNFKNFDVKTSETSNKNSKSVASQLSNKLDNFQNAIGNSILSSKRTSEVPRIFTPSSSMTSPNSFRPSSYFSPFFITPNDITSRSPTITPASLVTQNHGVFVPSKSPPASRDSQLKNPFPGFIWVWPKEKEQPSVPKQESKPSFHAL